MANKNKKCASIYNSIRNVFGWISGVFSMLFGLFLNYEKANDKLNNSYLANMVRLLKSKLTAVHSVKRKIAGIVEKSFFTGCAGKLSAKILEMPLRNFGVMFFFFGMFSLIISAFSGSEGILRAVVSKPQTFTIGMVTIVLAGIMSLSQRPIGYLVTESKLFSFLFFDILSLKRKDFSCDPGKPVVGNLFFAVAGILFGLLTILFSPQHILFFILLLPLVFAVIRNPETGMILVFLLLPFVNEEILLFLVCLCCFTFLFKFLRNKRMLKVELFDVAVLFFLLIVLLNGLNGISGVARFASTMKIIIFLVFGWLLSNSIKTSMLTEKCIKAFILSVSVFSFVEIILFILDIYFPHGSNIIFDSIRSFFEAIPFTAEADFAELSVMALPFAAASFNRTRLYSCIAFALCLAAAMISLDITAWLVCILALVIYFSMLRPVVLPAFALSSVVIVVACFIFPDAFSSVHDFIHEYTNHSDLTEKLVVANGYGVTAAAEFWFTGAGTGDHVISHIFKCIFGTEASVYVDYTALSVHLLIQFGVSGLVSAAIMVASSVSNGLSLYFHDSFCSPKLRKYAAACVAVIVSFAIKGLLFPTLTSDQSLLGFLLIMYIPACVRTGSLFEYSPEPHEMHSEDLY